MKKLFFFLAAMVVAMTANAKVTTISPDAENDALRLAVHYAEDGDIIEMTEGTYVQCNNGYVAFDGKAVTVRAAEGANVVLQPQVRITLANGGKATFENIKIDASRIHELADWYEHVFYVADATEGKQLVLNSCEFYGFDINKSAIYAGSDKKLDLCSLTNCYFHNNDKSCLFFEGESLGELSITNSTFANITAKVTDSYYAGVVDVRNSAAKVTIDHCTFYNCLLMNTDYAAITMKGPQAANVTISNNIFMLPEATDGQRAIRNDVEATNCMTFNYLKDNGGIHSSVTKTNCQLNVDPKFVDAANGNFALAEGSPALGAGTDGSNLGDPRWNAPAVEEPVYEVMELTMTNLEVMNYGSATGLYASDLDNGIEVMLFLDAEGKLMEEESSIATALGDYTVTGTVAKAYSEELETDVYTAELYAVIGETNFKLILTMYTIPAEPVEPTVVVVENATVEVTEQEVFGNVYTSLMVTGEWSDGETTYPVLVEIGSCDLTKAESEVDASVTVGSMGENAAWLGFADGLLTMTIADNVLTLKGVVENTWTTPQVFIDLTISGKLPSKEVELPAAAVRAWAYDLALAVEGEQYTFSYKATTAAKATLILTDAEGVEVSAIDLGIVEAGANSKVLAASELPAGKKLNWAVKLEAGAIAEVVEVTDQSRGIYDFYNMMDVLVDNNPESEYFGKIYVQMAYNGASDGMTDRSQTQTAGVFIYDQELNELNEPSNVGIKPILPEGYTMGDNRNKFHRLEIDPKTGNLTYCYNISGQPAVFSMDRANLTGEVTNLLEGVEGITRTSAHCFDADGALYVYDLPGAGIIHKVVDGVATVLAASDAKWVQASASMATDGRGGLWVAQNRGQIDTYYQLAHYTAEGTIDFAVYQGSENGFTGSSTRGAMAYDPELQLLAQGRNGAVEVYSVTYDAETGVPSLTLVATTPTVGTNIDGLHFDYAGDLYVVNSSKEKFQKFAMPTANNVCTTPAASKYAFEIVEPVEVVGTVKRAVQNGQEVIVLTHEESGAAHIYRVVNGVAVAELSQEGVVAVDPENAGDLLAISDIAVTEDGKLVAINKIVCQAGDAQVDEGYKRGETRVYIWNDLAGDPSIWFTSKMSSNWYRSVQGHTMAYKGTSTNGTLFTTGVTATGTKFRYSVYNVIDGVYTDPAVNDSEYYHYTKGSAQETTNVGANYELNVSALADNTWVLDGELINPFEITDPLTYNTEVTAGATLNEDLGKKYNGASYVTVGEKVLMVAPYATPEGKLIGVEILDITNGLAGALYVDMLYLDDAVEAAAAAATAVKVVEGEDANSLVITLVADATIYSLEKTISTAVEYQVYEDEITNLVIDLDNLVLIGGPSSAFQVDVFLGLGEYNRNDDTYQLLPESSVALMGTDATFVEGYAYEVDAFTPSAKAVVRCVWNGMNIELHLTMSAAPLEATKVVVENATIEIEKYVIFGDMYDYSLKMTGVWTDTTDNTTYPVLVEVPVYYPEATEPSTIFSTVTVGGNGDNDPWLGFGEGDLTITTVDGLVTATGIVQNPLAGIAIDITISGKLAADEPTKYTVTATVNPAEAGTVTGAGEYEEGAEVTLAATAAEGYEFVNWTVAGAEVATTAEYTFTVTADVEVVANFVAASAVDNIPVTVKAVKVVKNGQLVIIKGDAEYNAQGAVIK